MSGLRANLNDAILDSADSAKELLQFHPSKRESMIALAVFIGVPLAFGQVVGLLSATQITSWYKTLHKPKWQPPAFIFGPVWSVLYIIMGYTGWQIWTHGGWASQCGPLSLWIFQLVFNLFWNPLFFLKHDMSLALFDIGALWALLVVMTWVFHNIEPLAGYLQLPYLAWVSFASVLNYTLLNLNTRPATKSA